MGQRRISPSGALTFVGTLGYPLLVYNYIGVFPPLAFVGLGLILISIRLLITRRFLGHTIWVRGLVLAALLLIIITMISASLAVKAYPIMVSLIVASVFGFSLLYPPTIVERMARITQPNLSVHGVAYTRKVTIIWLVFLLGNAAISAATALWGSLAQWTLWNGLISYLIMGTLFAAEYAVRKRVRQ